MNEDDMMALIADGNINAFEQLYKDTYKKVFVFILSMTKCRDTAEDLMHDTYMRVFEKSRSYQTGTRVSTWIMTIAKNITYDYVTNSYSHCNFYEIYGDVYSRLGDNEKALEYWDKAVISEFGMGGWFKRAFMFKDLCRLEEAALEWEKIINLLKKHDNPQFLDWPKEELAKIQKLLNK